MMWIVILLKL